MLGYAWTNLIHQIPPALQELLTIITTMGSELQVQAVIRLEHDFLVVRGRTTGCMEAGMVMIIPFDQISYVSFVRKLTDAEVGSIFDNFTAPAVAHQGGAVPAQSAPPLPMLFAPPAVAPAKPEPAPVAATAPNNPDPTPSRTSQPSKSILLAKLRARLAQDSSHTPSGK